MADVASAAGVSRQTLYNEFGSKDALAQALAMRETERFLDGIETAVAAADPDLPAAAVAAAVTFALDLAAGNPLVKAALTDDAGGLLPFLTTRAEPLLTAARSHIAAYLVAHWPALPRDEVDVVAEAVVRLTVSYLVLPSDAPDASSQALGRRIAHLVERLLA
jgi:AcrR family transcriptional regulator